MLRFFTFCLFALPIILPAQSYLNPSSTWRYRGGSSDAITTTVYDRRFYLDGDTTIAGQPYFKLYYDRQDTLYVWSNIVGFDTTLHTYHGAIREAAKRFYMVYFYETAENLIQDFSLTLGDTLTWASCWYPLTVTAIDTVYLGPTPLKRFFLNGFTNAFILEGACGTSGFNVTCPGPIGIEYSLDPVCYGRDGYTVPFVAGSSDCTLNVSATQMPFQRNLLLRPNPSGGLVHLDLPAAPAAVRIFNVRGEAVLRKTRQNESLTLDLTELPDGLYFIAAQNGAQTYIGKVLLMK